METLIINDKINHLLQNLQFKDINDVLKDYLMTELLCKISNFNQQIDFFEKKYCKALQEVKTEYEKNEEKFEVYDDLMTWEFASQGKEYWQEKLDELKNVL